MVHFHQTLLSHYYTNEILSHRTKLTTYSFGIMVDAIKPPFGVEESPSYAQHLNFPFIILNAFV